MSNTLHMYVLSINLHMSQQTKCNKGKIIESCRRINANENVKWSNMSHRDNDHDHTDSKKIFLDTRSLYPMRQVMYGGS